MGEGGGRMAGGEKERTQVVPCWGTAPSVRPSVDRRNAPAMALDEQCHPRAKEGEDLRAADFRPPLLLRVALLLLIAKADGASLRSVVLPCGLLAGALAIAGGLHAAPSAKKNRRSVRRPKWGASTSTLRPSRHVC